MTRIEFNNTDFLYDENRWDKSSSSKKNMKSTIFVAFAAIFFFAILFGVAFLLTVLAVESSLVTVIVLFLFVVVFFGLFSLLIFKVVSMIYGKDEKLYTILDWISKQKDFETIYANEKIMFVARNNNGSDTFGIKGFKYRFQIDDDLFCINMEENLGNSIKSEIDICNYPLVSISLKNKQ